MLNFTERMVKAELEEFELDKSSVFDLSTQQGLYNQHAAVILLGTFEVCLHTHVLYSFSRPL